MTHGKSWIIQQKIPPAYTNKRPSFVKIISRPIPEINLVDVVTASLATGCGIPQSDTNTHISVKSYHKERKIPDINHRGIDSLMHKYDSALKCSVELV